MKKPKKKRLLFRGQLVKKLRHQIVAAKKTEGENKFLLSGFGGVGKTAVARALFHKLKSQCKKIGWVECGKSSDLRASLLASVKRGITAETEQARFEQIKTLLDDDTILFLDNVDKLDPMLDDLTGYDVTLVVISRMERVEGYTSIFIPQLSEKKCVKLFRAYCTRHLPRRDNSVVRELVNMVNCHTLSVELMAKHFSGLGKNISLATYLEQLKEKGFGFFESKIYTKYDQKEDTIINHLRMLLDMSRLDGEQTRVLQNLALMADNPTLPFEVKDWIGCKEAALAALARIGWLTQTKDGYELHPIVREIVPLDEVPLSAVKHYFHFVTCEAYFRRGEDYRAVQSKLGIVESVLAQVGDRMEENTDTAALYNELGIVYRGQGQYARAEEYFLEALRIRCKVLREEDQTMASIYNNLGLVYSYQKQYDQAEKYYRKALNTRRKVLEARKMPEEEDPETAKIYDNLGNSYNSQEQYDQAEKYLQKALNIRRKVLGEEHPGTADSYDNLGNFYLNRNKYANAKECFQKALHIRAKVLKVLDEEGQDMALSYHHLGLVYNELRKYDQAEEYFQKELGICRKALGENHWYTAKCYESMGVFYNNQEKYVKAKRCLQKALNIYRKRLGDNHPYTADGYHALGAVYLDWKGYTKAEEYTQKALDVYRKAREENKTNTDSDMADSYYNLGTIYKYQKKYDAAVEQYLNAWRIYQRILGPEHPYTKRAERNLRSVFPHIAHSDEDFETWLSRQQED